MKRFFFLILCTLLLLPGCGRRSAPAPAPTPSPVPADTDALIRRLISSYPEGTEALLASLTQADPAQGAMWQEIVRCWDYVNSTMPVNDGVLPDGLPEDGRLCLVVLGYRLAPDGSMDPELEQRCQTALASAEKYPRAHILVTGGPTSFAGGATEAGRMAEWLIGHGVDAERLLIEDAAMTSAENASLGAALLRERCPQADALAIISSDYHVPLGCLLFSAQAQREALETGQPPYTVVSNAACAVPEKAGTQGIRVQAVFLSALMCP